MHAGSGERYSILVALEFAVGEHLAPASVGAFEEERFGTSLKNALEVTDLVGVCTHTIEDTALNDARPERCGDVDVEEASDAAHLAIEVG